MTNILDRNAIIEINDKVRKSSSTLLEFLQNIEKELIECKHLDVPIHSLKMYKGSMGLVDTTHSSPIGQRSTGWFDNPHIAEIGWNGRMQITYKGTSVNGSTSDITRCLSINSGSGSYNGGKKENLYKMNLEARLYIKDLPLILEQYLEFIDTHSQLINMLESEDIADRKLLEAICEESDIGNDIKKMYSILTGYNLYKENILNYSKFVEIITPYQNNKNQRKVWNENRNIGWMIIDEFFKYTYDDFTYL